MPGEAHKLKEKQAKAKYTLEFKQEAAWKVKAGRAAASMAATLDMTEAGLTNWMRADSKGQLTVTPEGKAGTSTVILASRGGLLG